MKIATLLYGQPRTLKYTFPSIERLFKNILNTDFFVIINENTNTQFPNNLCDGGFSNQNDLLSIDELDARIKSLHPVVYEKVNINKTIVFDELTKDNKYEIMQAKFYSTSWDDYKQMPHSNKIYDIDNCIKNNCKLSLVDNRVFKNLFVELNNVEQYMRNKLLYLVRKSSIEYTHIFLIRTDTIWFETYDQLLNILQTDRYLSYEAPTLSNVGLVDVLNNYNNNINELNYTELCNNFKKIIINNNEDVISLYSFNSELNLWLPIEQQGLFRYNNIVYKEIIDSCSNFEEFNKKYIRYILKQFSQFPLIGPNWEGETHQCKRHTIMNNNISKDFHLSNYSRIIRNNKVEE